ncbi:MAG TPA: FixG Ig-like domain-containing protein, partial [Rudaea sp.]
VNKTEAAQHLRVDVIDAPELSVGSNARIDVAAGQVANVPLTLRAERGNASGRRAIEIALRDESGAVLVRQQSQFFAPGASR